MDKKVKIRFSTGVKYNNMYYLTAMHMNALFMYDEKNEKLTVLAKFQKEKKKEYLYLKAFLYENEAWFIPGRAAHIAIVNLDTYHIRYLPLDYQKRFNREETKYINVLCFNKKYLCLIPWAVDSVMVIDLQNKDTVTYQNIVDQNTKYHDAIYLNGKICFFPWRARDILVLDLKTNERINLPRIEEEESFGDVVYDKNSDYIFHAPAKENYILIDNLNGDVYKKIKFDCWNDKKYKTFYSSEGKDDIFFWGHEKNIVIKINKKDRKVKVYTITPESTQKYFYPIGSDDIEALVYNESCIVKYNTDKDEFSYLYPSIDYNVLIQEMKTKSIDFMEIRRNEFLNESDDMNLMVFLNCPINMERIRNNKTNSSIGEQIYGNI